MGSQIAISIRDKPVEVRINSIAIISKADEVADVVGLKLASYDYKVNTRIQTTSLLRKLAIFEGEITKPSNLSKIKREKIDALLFLGFFCGAHCKGSDNLPDIVTARMVTVRDGSEILGLWWNNGVGGRAGAPIDQTVRRSLNEIAQEITKKIVSSLEKINSRVIN